MLQASKRTVKNYGFISIEYLGKDDAPINIIVGYNLVHPFTYVRSTAIKSLKLDQQKTPMIALTASGSEYNFEGLPVKDFRELDDGVLLIESLFGIERDLLMQEIMQTKIGNQGVSIEELGGVISESEAQANEMIAPHVEQIMDVDGERVTGIIIRKAVKVALVDPIFLSEKFS